MFYFDSPQKKKTKKTPSKPKALCFQGRWGVGGGSKGKIKKKGVN